MAEHARTRGAPTYGAHAQDAPAHHPRREIAYLPPTTPPANHGHTFAAWFAMIAVMVGVLIAGIGVALAAGWAVVAGGVVVVVGLLGGLVLRAMGFGQKVVPR